MSPDATHGQLQEGPERSDMRDRYNTSQANRGNAFLSRQKKTKREGELEVQIEEDESEEDKDEASIPPSVDSFQSVDAL